MAASATSSYGIIQSTFPFGVERRSLAGIGARDAVILKRLAHRKREIADDPRNLERREVWYRHNALAPARPLVLAEIQGCLPELAAAGHLVLQCESPLARSLELTLRSELYQFEVLQDDHVVEPWTNVNWIVTTTGHVEASETHVHVPTRTARWERGTGTLLSRTLRGISRSSIAGATRWTVRAPTASATRSRRSLVTSCP